MKKEDRGKQRPKSSKERKEKNVKKQVIKEEQEEELSNEDNSYLPLTMEDIDDILNDRNLDSIRTKMKSLDMNSSSREEFEEKNHEDWQEDQYPKPSPERRIMHQSSITIQHRMEDFDEDYIEEEDNFTEDAYPAGSREPSDETV